MAEPAPPSSVARPWSNEAIARKLEEAADVLELQAANPFRANAYRRAARALLALDPDVATIADRQGRSGLMALPGIGPGIAAAIDEILRTGKWSRLERLRGSLQPELLFRTIPGVGAELARRIHEELGVDTLEALEAAAHDGRLAAVRGIGPRRIAAFRAALAQVLSRARPSVQHGLQEPSVAMLLDVDRAYRAAAAAGSLTTIAPRRFNPTGKAWLPILHTERGPWRFTALFSNTARAHSLGRTQDWVLIHFNQDDEVEGQRTVVTETHGRNAGRRVVRGREGETPAAAVA
jgi:DNA polymerase (family X)